MISISKYVGTIVALFGTIVASLGLLLHNLGRLLHPYMYNKPNFDSYLTSG